jgi:hypothetical protein
MLELFRIWPNYMVVISIIGRLSISEILIIVRQYAIIKCVFQNHKKAL